MSKTPHKIQIHYLWLIAGIIILFSNLLIGSEVYARWLSSSTGSDKAQVAIYALSAECDDIGELSIDVTQGETTAEYAFVIRNQERGTTSQVPVRYEIDLTLPESLPEGVSLNVDGIAGTVSTDGLTYTFSDPDWEFSAFVSAEREHLLIFSVDSSFAIDDIQLNGISIVIVFEQILDSI